LRYLVDTKKKLALVSDSFEILKVVELLLAATLVRAALFSESQEAFRQQLGI